MEAKNLKLNETFYVNTHVEFINKIFNSRFRGFKRHCFRFNHNHVIWAIRFDKKASKKVEDRWKTYYQDDIIKEVYCGERQNDQSDSYSYDWTTTHLFVYKRLVFELTYNKNKEKMYVFRGVYEYQIKESDPSYIRIYKRISDNYDLTYKKILKNYELTYQKKLSDIGYLIYCRYFHKGENE